MTKPVVEFQNWIEPENDVRPQDSFSEQDDINWVLEQIRQGNEAGWCFVVVTATLELGGRKFVGRDNLGGVSYETEKQLWKDLLPEMKANALLDLLAQMREFGQLASMVLVTMDQLLEDPKLGAILQGRR